MRIRYRGQYIRIHTNAKGEASMNGEFWEFLRRLNDEGVNKTAVLQQLGFIFPPADGEALSRCEFVLLGETKYACIRCGSCCRSVRGGCPLGAFDDAKNFCKSYVLPHPACRRFPFRLLNAIPFRNVLMVASYCKGVGDGKVIDKLRYGDIVSSLLAPPPKEMADRPGIIFDLHFDQFQNRWVFER